MKKLYDFSKGKRGAVVPAVQIDVDAVGLHVERSNGRQRGIVQRFEDGGGLVESRHRLSVLALLLVLTCCVIVSPPFLLVTASANISPIRK